ncbi:hypothetical protein QMN58_24790, partial [Escherichia coli]|nr:hypothetical protein [Escherichia coli]
SGGAARADARRKYDPEQTKRNILDVATQEFSAMGLTGPRRGEADGSRCANQPHWFPWQTRPRRTQCG